MPSYLKARLGGITNDEFFDRFGLDPILWTTVLRADPARGEYADPGHVAGYLEPRRVVSDSWRITAEAVPGQEYPTVRYTFHTPRADLTTVLQSNEHTSWVTERLIKEKADVDVIADFATKPRLDVDAVNRASAEYGERGLVRGTVVCFDVYGQPGCWQDAAVLCGIERLIMETYDDPEWVRHLLDVLFERKKVFLESTAGAHYDVIELGGGDASSTVISPRIFEEFVAPYDAPLIRIAHEAGQRIVYHTCGGMMPFLERLAAMEPDAMETFTPAGMGGDTRLAEAKRRIGRSVCMIGGFDQFHYFVGNTPEETRKAVRECFRAAGEGGGYILCPSDHFFDAEPELLHAFADEARRCVYN
jgi:uroporphyrinogen-III decarboxylase